MKSLLLRLIRFLGRLWCRLHGAEVNRSALIHGLPRISRKSGARVILESGCTLNAAPWSNPLNDGRLTVLFAGPGALIHFKKNSGASSSRIIAFKEIRIGEGSLIGSGCLICDSDMHEVPLGSGHPVKASPIQIGSQVFIGANCTILKGVTIGDGAVIGARSVVCHDIPAGSLAAGNPAKILRNF
jgi:acetyltransferase-like isoleucine patch superfamily enzyme